VGLGVAGAAEARSFRVDEIPNGRARSCQTCHETSGGVTFNPFGSDVRGHLGGEGQVGDMHVEWGPELAARDSDGDGATNGEELGDPDGAWRVGDASPGGNITAPGDPENAAGGGCGDGQLAPAETCDGFELRGETCESQNLGKGELLCGLDCHYDSSKCDRSTEQDAGPAPAADEGCGVGGAGRRGSAGLGAAILGVALVPIAVQRFSRRRTSS
jgi:hypothetical protein